MKIKSLHIYGFGKLQNVKVDLFSPTVQVFYGENEAGKSTIMAFIHAILFGFPTKNQAELRYEPKTGFQYGGYLTVETKEQGIVKIERVNGRSTGEVTVYFEDGTTSTSTETIVNGMEKSLFKGVFSFNIMDIQNVKLTNLDELGSYLFSSGMIGTDQLQKLGQKLEKETDALFKPGGRKPILNEMLSTLKDKKAQLVLWEEKIGEYERLQSNVEKLNSQIENLTHKQKQLQIQKQLTDQMISITPLYTELIQYDSKLQTLPMYKPFPINGVTRLESLQKEWTFFESKINTLTEQMNEINSKLDNIPETQLQEKLKALESITDLQLNYEQLEQALEQLTITEHNLKSKIQQIKESIGWENKLDSEILCFQTTLQTKMQLRELVFEEKQLEEEKVRVDKQFSTAKEELENSEFNIKQLKAELLPEQEKNRLNNLINENKRSSIENEIRAQEKILEQLKKQRAQQEQAEKVSKKSTVILFSVLSVVCAGLAIYGFSIGNIGLSLIAIFCLGGTFLFTFSKKSKNSSVEWKEEEKNILAELSKLKKELSEQRTSLDEINKVQKLLIENEQVEKMLVKEMVLLRQHERSYEKTVSLYEAWEQKKFLIDEKWKNLNEIIDLSEFQISFMEEAFEEISALKKYLLELEEVSIDKKLHENELNDLVLKIQSNNKKLGFDYNNLNHCFYLARNEQEQLKNLIQTMKHLKEKLVPLAEEKRLLIQQQVEVVKQMDQLYVSANVSTEEKFREKAEQNAIGVDLEQRRDMLQAQITQLEKLYEVSKEDWLKVNDWNYELILVKEDIHSIENQLQERYKEKATYLETIKVLEAGTTYAMVKQDYENEKALFERLAKKWSVFETAKHLLNKTMNYYQEVKLPQVLEKATKYFNLLTGGKYVKVMTLSSEKTLVVEHKDGMVFLPKELSQATIEQLYIALRFAVAAAWSNEKALPFIIDDTFVNFDSNRTDLAMKLLEEITNEGNQIIFFTCHHFIKEKLSMKKGAIVYVMEESTMFAT
ncbi:MULTISPECIES: ATP-binding protein [Bacillus]|uniref:ATP-binding protein n=1 Tax=Bacillus TaxID=1386 RepID=UPI000BB917E9|nr:MULTISPECIES: AAA family ATPase [Bacillus]